MAIHSYKNRKILESLVKPKLNREDTIGVKKVPNLTSIKCILYRTGILELKVVAVITTN